MQLRKLAPIKSVSQVTWLSQSLADCTLCINNYAVDQPQIIGDLVRGAAGQGNRVRISFKAPLWEGITIRFCVHQGQIAIYASTSVPNPSAALHDWTMTIRALQYQHTIVCSTIFFDNLDSPDLISEIILPGRPNHRCRRSTGRNSNDYVTFYISIEGVESSNEFSINSSRGGYDFGKSIAVRVWSICHIGCCASTYSRCRWVFTKSLSCQCSLQ